MCCHLNKPLQTTYYTQKCLLDYFIVCLGYYFLKILITKLLDIFGFAQLTDPPTRGNNILDLFLTNRPSLIHIIRFLPDLVIMN